MAFHENDSLDVNVKKVKKICNDYKSWELNFPLILNKLSDWNCEKRNLFLFYLFCNGKIDGGAWLPYIKSIDNNYRDFFIWLKKYEPNNDFEREQKENLLMLYRYDYKV